MSVTFMRVQFLTAACVLLLCACGSNQAKVPTEHKSSGKPAQQNVRAEQAVVVVTSRQVKKGELFSSLNVEAKTVDGDSAPLEAIESVEEVRGLAATTDLAAGTILSRELAKDVMAPN
jgi:flagella basal body P-ring formation protein FlgA